MAWYQSTLIPRIGFYFMQEIWMWEYFCGNLLAPDYRCLFSELSYELQSMTIGTNLSCPSWKKISETFRCLVREFLMLPFQCRPQGTLQISYISHFPDNLALHTFVMTLIHIFISVI